ncbi:hypothetical protein C8F01DRAFT_1267685 [Mycena amicta]|nr:hypothetical protein C8F01DRAFT_1267685 [Mycena amicta]
MFLRIVLSYVPQELASPGTSSTKPRPRPLPSIPPTVVLSRIPFHPSHDTRNFVVVMTVFDEFSSFPDMRADSTRLATSADTNNASGLRLALDTSRIPPSSSTLAVKTISRPTPLPPLASPPKPTYIGSARE